MKVQGQVILPTPTATEGLMKDDVIKAGVFVGGNVLTSRNKKSDSNSRVRTAYQFVLFVTHVGTFTQTPMPMLSHSFTHFLRVPGHTDFSILLTLTV